MSEHRRTHLLQLFVLRLAQETLTLTKQESVTNQSCNKQDGGNKNTTLEAHENRLERGLI